MLVAGAVNIAMRSEAVNGPSEPAPEWDGWAAQVDRSVVQRGPSARNRMKLNARPRPLSQTGMRRDARPARLNPLRSAHNQTGDAGGSQEDGI